MARGGVANVNDLGTGIKSWYFELPPFCRTYITLVLVSTLASFTLGLLDLRHVALLWPKVFKKFEVRQVLPRWRQALASTHAQRSVAPAAPARVAGSSDTSRSAQIWRLLTNFFIVAKPSFKLVIYIMWIVQYMIPLERETYQFEPADFLYMLLFNSTLINIGSLLLGFLFNGVCAAWWGLGACMH